MEKVLLAVNGTTPDKKTFKYAIDLCMRIKADLKILQVISLHEISDYFAKIKTKANNTRRFVENTMLAATYAEAGEYESACSLMAEGRKNVEKLLLETTKAGVICDLHVKAGDTNKEIANYVHKNNDIVVMIYDTPRGDYPKSTERQIKKDLKMITRVLPVPVVMVSTES